MPTNTKFDMPENGFWALIELFGHQRVAGFVSEYNFGGETFVRVDVPALEEITPFTRMFGKGAIYAINPLAEVLARRMATSLRVAPLQLYDLTAPKQRRLPLSEEDE